MEGAYNDFWEYLFLKKGFQNWNQYMCDSHFALTCGLLKGLPELDEPRSDTAQCEGWCDSVLTPGFVAFYRLAGGKEVPLHGGPSNQRLKCQLVIDAPPKSVGRDISGAHINVAGIRHDVETGQVQQIYIYII